MHRKLAKRPASGQGRSTEDKRQHRHSRQQPSHTKSARPMPARRPAQQPAAHLTQKPGRHRRKYDHAPEHAAMKLERTAVERSRHPVKTAQEIPQLTCRQSNRHNKPRPASRASAKGYPPTSRASNRSASSGTEPGWNYRRGALSRGRLLVEATVRSGVSRLVVRSNLDTLASSVARPADQQTRCLVGCSPIHARSRSAARLLLCLCATASWQRRSVCCW